MGVWLAATVVDIIYSAYVVNKHNKGLKSSVSRIIYIPKEISFDINPRVDYYSGNTYTPDGIDLSISMRF